MSFAEDLSFGREGEVIVRNLLESSGNFDYVIDCSNDKYFQDKDIDLLALATDGHIAKYEVKTDRIAHETGNIAFEIKTSGNIGCLAKTEADFVMYYIEGNGRLYCFNAEQMRRYLRANRFRLYRMGDNAEGHLLSINRLLRDGQIKRIRTYE